MIAGLLFIGVLFRYLSLQQQVTHNISWLGLQVQQALVKTDGQLWKICTECTLVFQQQEDKGL